MEGIPVSVSAVTRTTDTSLFPFFAYSTKYTAAKIPKGPATKRDNIIMKIVLIIAGNIETFSELYSSSNNCGVKCGTPFIKIYPTIKISVTAVKIALIQTNKAKRKEAG